MSYFCRCTLRTQKKPISERKGEDPIEHCLHLCSAHARLDMMALVLMSPLPKHCCMTTMYVQKKQSSIFGKFISSSRSRYHWVNYCQILTSTGLYMISKSVPCFVCVSTHTTCVCHTQVLRLNVHLK